MILNNKYSLFGAAALWFSFAIIGSEKNNFQWPNQSKVIKNNKTDAQLSMITKFCMDSLFNNKFILRRFHLSRGKTPKMNLFISEAFDPGRKLGDSFDEPFIVTSVPYKQATEHIRRRIIKIELEARDFSFGFAGYTLAKAIEKGTSKIPALKILALGVGLEVALEEKYINRFFSVDEQSLYTQKNKTRGNTIIKRQRDEF